MRQLAPQVEEHNYAKTPLSADSIREIVAQVGSVDRVVNLRHEIAKDRGWKDKAPSQDEFVAAAERDNNLLRRPILVHQGRAVIGFDEPAIRQCLAP